jgi:hypothetical protein
MIANKEEDGGEWERTLEVNINLYVEAMIGPPFLCRMQLTKTLGTAL